MIENRPASLLADPAYSILPWLPISLDWSPILDLVHTATLDLGGIQPITKAMVNAAGGTLHDILACCRFDGHPVELIGLPPVR